MYWIRTHKGNAVNLARATDVCLRPSRDNGLWEVICCWWDSPETDASVTVIAKGDKGEMTTFRDSLVNDLLKTR